MLSLSNHIQRTDMWCIFFGRLDHVLECHDQACQWKITPGYFEACRASMEPVYIRTHVSLKELGRRGSAGLKIIAKFAGQLQLSEASILATWKHEKKCCNPFCDLRGSEEETKMMSKLQKCSKCVRGDEVYYHGKTCRRTYVLGNLPLMCELNLTNISLPVCRDWKRHKFECALNSVD